MSLRIVFAGTPEFSVATLQALIDHQYEVVAVYTQPDRPRGRGKKIQMSPVKQTALKYDIPIFQPQSLRNIDTQREFAELKPDLLIVVAYGLLLPEEILKIPTYGCLNIHASLLPRWRGAAPLHRAIEAGDSETGVAIMQMDKGLDTGDVWSEARVEIAPLLTTEELHNQLQILGAELLIHTIPKVIDGREKPIKQNDVGITYATKIEKEEAHLDWSMTGLELMHKIHAFNPNPGAFSYLGDLLIKFWNCELTDRESTQAPGTMFVESEELFIVTGDHKLLRILTIQSAGRRRMETAQFLQGNDVHNKVLR